MLGASSRLQIRNGLISGQDTTLVGGYSQLAAEHYSEDTYVLQTVSGMYKLLLILQVVWCVSV